jgi:hypothetical protein
LTHPDGVAISMLRGGRHSAISASAGAHQVERAAAYDHGEPTCDGSSRGVESTSGAPRL